MGGGGAGRQGRLEVVADKGRGLKGQILLKPSLTGAYPHPADAPLPKCHPLRASSTARVTKLKENKIIQP